MALVVFFLAFNVLLVARCLRQEWRQANDPDAPPAPRRMTPDNLRAFGIRQVLLVAVLAFTFLQGSWTLESVGLLPPMMWLSSILVGEIAFLGLVLAYAGLLFVARRIPAMRAAATRGNLRAWPRKRSHKILAAIFIMVFNPFTEELVMRGILVHHWSLLLGSAVVPVVVGFVLNAALHWYQGWRMQLWHAMYYCLAVYLLFNWDLGAAITAHVFGDVIPFLTLRRELRRVRAARRAARAARARQAVQPA
ncbi:MAG TPA: CPBP family glutamic-type intramembrane protease [Steroidobacteraceae bacterium]|jgi:hypothetical protein|nr:CPBP family glutamic-type intramembrane protease [Steroidobacteraceae bacterium]